MDSAPQNEPSSRLSDRNRANLPYPHYSEQHFCEHLRKRKTSSHRETKEYFGTENQVLQVSNKIKHQQNEH